MSIFNNLFKRKDDSELAAKVAQLEEIIAKGVTNDSLIAFNNGNVEWYNLGKGNSYDDHYTIYRGIDMLASLGAGLSVNIYRGDTILDGDVVMPNGFNIHRPHPNMSLNQVLYTALVYFFYRGEFMIEVSDDPFLHLIPINPKSMTRITGTENWLYSSGNTRRTILEENLIYVQLFNPDDNSRGLSPVDVVKADLMNEKSAIAYNTKFFENFGQIGGFFYDKEGKARAQDMKQIVDQFEYLHKGANKAYKTLGLPGGIRYEDFAKTMSELQYLESRKDIRDRVLAVLGIHKALFGVTDQVNRSVSEEATRMLWIHNLKPKMLMIQDKINQVLFRRLFPAYRFIYDFSDIAELREGVDSIINQVKLYRDLGYTTNEINERFDLGMKDITDERGNIRLVPTNLVPIDDYLYSEEPEAKVVNPDEKSLIVDKFLEIEDKSTRISDNKFIRDQSKIFRQNSRTMAGKVGKFFSRELGQVIKMTLSRKNLKASVDVNSLLAEIQNYLTENRYLLSTETEPIYRAASLDADQLAIGTLGISAEPMANEMVVAELTNKVKNISNHTYRLIRTQVKDGVNAGETIDQIAKRIASVYKMQSSRSRIIARTEVGNVIHRTTDERYKDAGATHKKWLSAGDSKVRDSHINNANKGKVTYDFVYNNGQKFPNDGNGNASDNISCRCTYRAYFD
jgi:HK97 family phage portal protein